MRTSLVITGIGLSLLCLASAAKVNAAEQYGNAPGAVRRAPAADDQIPAPATGQKDPGFYDYGVGYALPWQPASGVHWRKNARLEYYARPPAPTWRWFTTGRGCDYPKGSVYGVSYPQMETYPYDKR